MVAGLHVPGMGVKVISAGVKVMMPGAKVIAGSGSNVDATRSVGIIFIPGHSMEI